MSCIAKDGFETSLPGKVSCPPKVSLLRFNNACSCPTWRSQLSGKADRPIYTCVVHVWNPEDDYDVPVGLRVSLSSFTVKMGGSVSSDGASGSIAWVTVEDLRYVMHNVDDPKKFKELQLLSSEGFRRAVVLLVNKNGLKTALEKALRNAFLNINIMKT